MWKLTTISVAWLLVAGAGAARADDNVFTEAAEHGTIDLGREQGLKVEAERWVEFSMGDYSACRLSVRWETEHGTSGTQELYDGMCVSDLPIEREGDELHLTFYGNRYDCEGCATILRYRFDRSRRRFVEFAPLTVDPWSDSVAHLEQLLADGDLVGARALAARMGATPNGGHSYETAGLFLEFLEAVHAEASRLEKAGEIRAAADLVLSLLAQPPVADGRAHSAEDELYLDASQFTAMGESRAYFHLPADPRTLRMINDSAYFLQRNGDHEPALILLRQVVRHAPDRAAAWLNLADSEHARSYSGACASYRRYVDLMRATGREHRIPARARERACVDQ